MWSVLGALHPAKHNPNRVSNYIQHKQSLDWSMLVFPTPLSQIPKFEKVNNIDINVFDYEKGEIYPRQITKFRFETHVNLLLFTDGEKRHFCLINMNMKVAKIIPIYKAKEKTIMGNYRPISLLPSASKILEKAVHHRLYDYCKKYTL